MSIIVEHEDTSGPVHHAGEGLWHLSAAWLYAIRSMASMIVLCRTDPGTMFTRFDEMRPKRDDHTFPWSRSAFGR